MFPLFFRPFWGGARGRGAEGGGVIGPFFGVLSPLPKLRDHPSVFGVAVLTEVCTIYPRILHYSTLFWTIKLWRKLFLDLFVVILTEDSNNFRTVISGELGL